MAAKLCANVTESGLGLISFWVLGTFFSEPNVMFLSNYGCYARLIPVLFVKQFELASETFDPSPFLRGHESNNYKNGVMVKSMRFILLSENTTKQFILITSFIMCSWKIPQTEKVSQALKKIKPCCLLTFLLSICYKMTSLPLCGWNRHRLLHCEADRFTVCSRKIGSGDLGSRKNKLIITSKPTEPSEYSLQSHPSVCLPLAELKHSLPW